MRSILLFLALFIAFFAQGSNFLDSKGPQARAMGGASITMSNAWACFNNQAALSFVEQFEMGVSVSQLFNVQQLTQAQAAIAIPFENIGVLGFSLDHMAITDVLSQQRLGLSLSRKFSETFAVGMQIEAFYLNLFNYGNKWLVNAHLGFFYNPTKQLNLAFYLQNPYGALLYEPFNERLPTIARLGGNYTFSDALKLYSEVSLSTQQSPRLHAGLSYMVNDKLTLRTGVTTGSLSTAFGLDIKLGSVNVLLAFSYHQTLGSTPELGMAYVAGE